jgi:hypothetical protein
MSSLHVAASTTTWTPSRPPTCQNHTRTGFGGNELKADVQEYSSLDRIKWSQVSGMPRAGGSSLSSTGRPYVLFSDLKYNIHMYVFVCKLLPRGRELGQQVRPDCLVRIY